MGVYGGPEIVESGLVLALDAGNTKSYDKYENLLQRSQELATSPWATISGVGGGFTVTNNVTTAPDGSFTASQMNSTTWTSGDSVYQDVSASGTGTYTLSIFIKGGTCNSISFVAFFTGNSTQGFSFNYNPLTGQITSGSGTVVAYPNSWYRIYFTVTGTNALNNNLRFQVYTNTTGITYLWGAQLEKGSSANDYYATTTTAKTRGTTWTDLSGRGNNGTLTNGPTYTISNTGSLVFDGLDDYITNGTTDFSIANNLFSDSNGSWTVSAWFKFPVSPTQLRDNTVNTGNCSYAIVGRSGGIATGAAFALFVGGTTTTYGSFSNYCAVAIRGTNTAVSPSTVNTNTWNNAVITWNGTNNFSYFNGLGPNAVTTGIAVAQTYNLDIGNTGSLNTPATGYHNFEGSISNVSIYNRALTVSEIQQNFNAQRSRFGI